MRRHWPLILLIAVQAICAAVFVADIAATVLGLRSQPMSWALRELLQIGAAFGLLLGTLLGALALRRSEVRRADAETHLRRARSAFADLVAERFDEWALTPAERDVAMFSLKGLTLADMATLRGTSGGTIKAQSAAVYRKAGVSSRAQFVSLFVEDLMDDPRDDSLSARLPDPPHDPVPPYDTQTSRA